MEILNSVWSEEEAGLPGGPGCGCRSPNNGGLLLKVEVGICSERQCPHLHHDGPSEDPRESQCHELWCTAPEYAFSPAI